MTSGPEDNPEDTPEDTPKNPNEALALRVDIVSDVVCPWCIIGYRQLERALAAEGLTAEVHWHPFELNPSMGPEGQELREHVAEKYGSTPEESQAARQRLSELGQSLDFPMDYFEGMRIWNTFAAHQLLHWAGELGKGSELKRALFESYFQRREKVDDRAVLIAAVERAGLDGGEAAQVLEDERYAKAVRDVEQFWIERGIQGVPAMVFQGRYLLSGAQGEERYAAFLQQLREGVPA